MKGETSKGETSRGGTKTRHRRQEIIDAALRRFVEVGYEETSIEDISASLQMSPRTVHRYFRGKEQLALDWQYAALERCRRELPNRPADQPVAEWWREHVLHCARLNDRTELARQQHRLMQSVPSLESRRLAIIREYEDLLTAAIEAEMTETPPMPGTAHMRARLSALVLLGASETALDQWAYDPQGRSLHEHCIEALDVALAEFLPS